MSTLSDKFGLSKDQVRDALDFLESNSKVIKRHYRTIDSRTGKLSNVLYIELIPDVLMSLTYPELIQLIMKTFQMVVEFLLTAIWKNPKRY